MTYEDVKLKIDELLAVPHCAGELKEAANAYLASIGTENEKACAKAFVRELEEDVMPIDAVIAFFNTKEAIEKFGEKAANDILEGSKKAKAEGAKYCNCAACKAGEALLEIKDFFLKN